MRTSKILTLTALTVWTALAPALGQTVVWDRKAHGQSHPCLEGGSVWYWPNNNNWSQEEHWGWACPEGWWTVIEPSNWSTTNFPNNASCDVILGSSGGAPAHVDVPVAVHSVTVLPDGGLDINASTTLTAASLDFQGDGAVTSSGNGLARLPQFRTPFS